MKVILLADVYKHGVAGEVVEVADGFARNWLIPKKLAAQATEGELKRATKLREQAEARRAALEGRLNELARQIDGVELFFERRASATGKLFGSVTTQEIADELDKKTGIDINRRRISQMTLREIGTHNVPVRIGTEISPNLKVTIVREGELANYLAQREREAAKAAEAEAAAQAAAENYEYVPYVAPTTDEAAEAAPAETEGENA